MTSRPPQTSEWQRRAQLRDGTPILLRQIRPQDRERLREGFERLSPTSRFLRFHTVIEALSEDQLDYLTTVDHVDHEAIVALDVSASTAPGVGVARWIRSQDDATVGEAAVTVADDYHGRGVGTLLLGAIAERGVDLGLRTLRSIVLDANSAMLEVFDHLGASRRRGDEGTWVVEIAPSVLLRRLSRLDETLDAVGSPLDGWLADRDERT